MCAPETLVFLHEVWHWPYREINLYSQSYRLTVRYFSFDSYVCMISHTTFGGWSKGWENPVLTENFIKWQIIWDACFNHKYKPYDKTALLDEPMDGLLCRSFVHRFVHLFLLSVSKGLHSSSSQVASNWRQGSWSYVNHLDDHPSSLTSGRPAPRSLLISFIYSNSHHESGTYLHIYKNK